MTETLLKPIVDVEESEIITPSKVIKQRVLEYIFRNIPFTQANRVTHLSLDKYRQLRTALNIPIPIIRDIYTRFVVDLTHFKVFQHRYTIGVGLKSPLRKSLVYLWKVYRIAPVFDYSRAKVNLKSLIVLLSRLNYWPQIMTQVAVTLYITEVNSATLKKLIPQNKICILCD
ncbi:MAG: hypothetical protein ACFFB0_16390, partial [Promethearchaeota archaeon]